MKRAAEGGGEGPAKRPRAGWTVAFTSALPRDPLEGCALDPSPAVQVSEASGAVVCTTVKVSLVAIGEGGELALDEVTAPRGVGTFNNVALPAGTFRLKAIVKLLEPVSVAGEPFTVTPVNLSEDFCLLPKVFSILQHIETCKQPSDIRKMVDDLEAQFDRCRRILESLPGKETSNADQRAMLQLHTRELRQKHALIDKYKTLDYSRLTAASSEPCSSDKQAQG